MLRIVAPQGEALPQMTGRAHRPAPGTSRSGASGSPPAVVVQHRSLVVVDVGAIGEERREAVAQRAAHVLEPRGAQRERQRGEYDHSGDEKCNRLAPKTFGDVVERAKQEGEY